MLPIPPETKNPLKLADWMELIALAKSTQEISVGDLERELRRSGTYEPLPNEFEDDGEISTGTDQDEIEVQTDDVFEELSVRSEAALDAYPFLLEQNVLSVRGSLSSYVPYVFCLCLSYFGDGSQIHGEDVGKTGDDDGEDREAEITPIYPRRLFEHICAIAGAQYIGGKGIRFGWPRQGLPTDFGDAIEELCVNYLREGEGFNRKPHSNSKDRSLDVVAWKDFPDNSPSKLVLMGQCASNADQRDWGPKKFELQPGAFWSNWIRGHHVSELRRAFFIPHCIPKDQWDRHARDSGLIFDRCRVANYGSRDPAVSLTHNSDHKGMCLTWIEQCLEKVRGI